MFVRISNTPRDYAWGSVSAIPELLGTPNSGKPQAELWLGAHPGSPSEILDSEKTGGARDLNEWIAADPAAALGGGSVAGAGSAASEPRLPFLLKMLAASAPLSLQAHPSAAQAEEGFARENSLGIPLESPERNYKDASHKPEIIYVLSAEFEALCGFRDLGRTIRLFELLAATASDDDRGAIDGFRGLLAADGPAEAILHDSVAWLLGGGAEAQDLVQSVVRSAAEALARPAPAHEAPFRLELETVVGVAAGYPHDPGVVLSLLLNRVSLTRGEVLWLPAGNIHAYLHGVGVELMAASDNVLRGGLTPKHIDVPELLAVLSFTPVPVPVLPAERPAPGVAVFRPGVPEFVLTNVQLGAEVHEARLGLDGPAIVLCTSGELTLTGLQERRSVSRGEAVYITPDEDRLEISGFGELFVAMPAA